jgi:hypothetical protein
MIILKAKQYKSSLISTILAGSDSVCINYSNSCIPSLKGYYLNEEASLENLKELITMIDISFETRKQYLIIYTNKYEDDEKIINLRQWLAVLKPNFVDIIIAVSEK